MECLVITEIDSEKANISENDCHQKIWESTSHPELKASGRASRINDVVGERKGFGCFELMGEIFLTLVNQSPSYDRQDSPAV